jgi:hypothetical protein
MRIKKQPCLAIFILYLLVVSCTAPTKESSVKEVMDNVVSRFYQEFDKSQLDTLRTDFILHYLSDEEKSVLATAYWTFEVNVPVSVSLMRDSAQSSPPFWLEETGFKKTALQVKNSHSTYEVWQKDYDAGKIGLGINGFDKHRPVYFISVGAQDPVEELEIIPVFPQQQHFETLEIGAFTYHDWDGLTLTEVPDELKGQRLFTTIRGRAREAHLIGAFRNTDFPSSDKPDQVLLTWSDDVQTTMDVQWRTSSSVDKGAVEYWVKGSADTLTTVAERYVMEDRLLQNDRFVHRFTAKLSELQPGTSYEYRVGGTGTPYSDIYHFTTTKSEPSAFSFLWTGDVHNSEVWGGMMQDAYRRHPESTFYIAAGDLVNTGLHRDDWDQLMSYPGNVFAHIPFMAVPGNHDSQDGLGAWMYQEMFSYPENGPGEEMSELTYSFTYQNALFLMIDVTLPIGEQTNWIEEQLATSEQDWKFAVFHFPPYNSIAFYQDIIEAWGPLFDQYHVDMVISGHFHYYLRTKPIHGGKVVGSPAEGTIYLMSVGTTGKNKDMKPAEYAARQFGADHLYQHVEIDGNTLRYRTYGADGEVKDSLLIQK